MDFITQHIEIIVKGFAIALCGILYRAGGSDELPKITRRLGCALLIPLTGFIFHQNLWSLLSVPLYFGALSVGYGCHSHLTKLLKNPYIVRGVCGFLYSIASLPILFGNFYLFGYNIMIVTLGVMMAGNQKFQFDDKREEFFIGLMMGIAPILGG